MSIRKRNVRLVGVVVVGMVVPLVPVESATADDVVVIQGSGHRWFENGPSASTHVCALTKVSGHFGGGGEKIELDYRRDPGGWFLTGTSLQSGVAGQARCFPHSRFRSSKPGTVRWLSQAFTKRLEDGCDRQAATTWKGDALTMITGISGDFRSHDEGLQVFQSHNPYEESTLSVDTCEDWIQGRAHAYFVGVPDSGHKPRWAGGGSILRDPYSPRAAEYQEQRMAATAEAMCFLTEIRGDFAGYGESVRIYAKQGHWYLEVKSQSDEGIRGGASCYKFDQS